MILDFREYCMTIDESAKVVSDDEAVYVQRGRSTSFWMGEVHGGDWHHHRSHCLCQSHQAYPTTNTQGEIRMSDEESDISVD